MSVWTELELELVDAIDKSRKYRSKDIPTDLLNEVDSLIKFMLIRNGMTSLSKIRKLSMRQVPQPIIFQE